MSRNYRRPFSGLIILVLAVLSLVMSPGPVSADITPVPKPINPWCGNRCL